MTIPTNGTGMNARDGLWALPAANGRVVNALSIDVEDYYHALVFQEGLRAPGTDRFESRVAESMRRVLDLLGSHGVEATFFVLAEVAVEHPTIVREIIRARHEVACHGYHHVRVDGQSPEEFRTGIRRAKAVLEDIGGQAVKGYRAPNFSIGRTEAWAYEILAEEGFRYDSSIYPIAHDRYGDRSAPRFPYEIWRNGHTALVEFPIGTLRVLGTNLPIGGGGYFRLLPGALFKSAIRRVNAVERKPVMFYFHPWELDPGQPRPSMAWRHRFRHYVGMKRHEAKLGRLLTSVPFGAIRSVLRLA
jgi:polysaccharide deacetylase family protein (PEP-CTERM system associated)